MIIFVTTAPHTYTHNGLSSEEGMPAVEVITYASLLKSGSTKDATYILTDIDRLSAESAYRVALVRRRLLNEGRRVLNDPARMLSRYGLLRRLRQAGINDFNAYRAEELVRPKRWPVFLRLEGSHAAPLSGLLQNPEQLERATGKAVDSGCPYSHLLIVEYCAEPVRPGLYRRFSVMRVGDRMLGYTCAHDTTWLVKQGQPGIAPPELYEEEYEIVKNNPYAEQMRQVFALAGIEYGRVDFGMVAGRPQVYEINSNPNIKLRPPASPAPRRNETVEIFRSNYIEALKALAATSASSTLSLRKSRGNETG